MKQVIKKIPFAGSILRGIYRRLINPPKPFPGSENYWIERYESGGNSGDGSYNELAEFKAEVINDFVQQKNIKTVAEYGCGDGNQLKLANYPSYTGFDVSPKAVSICRDAFLDDDTKTFKLMDNYEGETADLTMSLDVIYHLVEDSVFIDYMNRLFDSSNGFVMIYSSNTDSHPEDPVSHVKHRNFSEWVKRKKSEWKLVQHIPNRHPDQGDTKTGSIADFFVFERG
ncbi:MAG: class I SAM-dependent methyltransferase [Verrucomicrobiales bacterium]